jgi:4-alpha-glucanotransferase
VTIGAPPDLLAQDGQTWGLTTFSPTALRAQAFEPFLATVRAALRHAGGVRIDHAIGLEHLWVTPEGAKASQGAYLSYPFEDLLRLLALESHRHRAIVIGEDLGTVPPGFRTRTTAAGVAGMRVLWFEQTAAGDFRAPSRWGRRAAAMTTTHDLATVAGWWKGHDIDWRVRVGAETDPDGARRARARDASRLWRAMRESGAVTGAQPHPDRTDAVVDAALIHVAGSDCDLALIGMEDVLGQIEQPNLPGLTEPHPNWRRRLPAGNGLDQPKAQARLKRLNTARGRPA